MTDSHAVTDFQADVLDASHETPVLVDFWAPWCGPCRVLGPTLDRLATEAAGRWRLAKVNTDEAPELMQAYGIRGIPAVKLFADGAVVAEFTGALPEPAVRQWLDEHLPSPARAHLDAALAAFADGDAATARIEARTALDSPEAESASWVTDAKTLLARLGVFDDPDGARALVDGLYTTEAEAVRTLADVLTRDPQALPEGTGRARTLDALTALRGGDVDGAIAAYLDVIRTDRYYDDDGARKAVVALFQTLGEGHEVTRRHRPAFNMSLY